MKIHSNLGIDINKNIVASELNGGVWLKDMPVGTRILVQTRNTLYTIDVTEKGESIFGHAHYCPEPVRCNIHGSTWGGSMLKMKFIGEGMHLEFSTENHPSAITTSMIQSVEVV